MTGREEKAQQAVVRFRELLDIMRETLENGEFAYADLFAHCSEEETEMLEESILQQQAALALANDPSAFVDTMQHLRDHSHHLALAFGELHEAFTFG